MALEQQQRRQGQELAQASCDSGILKPPESLTDDKRKVSGKKEKTKRRVGEIRAEATANLFHIYPQKQKHMLVCAVEAMEVSGLWKK